MNIQSALRLTPSLLARKILCMGYVPAPFRDSDRLKFQGLHAMTTIRVIARHLQLGYRLMKVEQGGGGYRIDLLFEAISTGRKRLNEVKSSKTIREVHRIQAALYVPLLMPMNIDEIAVSNKEIDEILSSNFIEEVQRRAQSTRQLLIADPVTAASTYTVHEDCCYVCENKSCPFLSTQPQSKPQLDATVSVGP
jgi:hypothetical protein